MLRHALCSSTLTPPAFLSTLTQGSLTGFKTVGMGAIRTEMEGLLSTPDVAAQGHWQRASPAISKTERYRRRLAQELRHVVQQSGRAPRRQDKLQLGLPRDRFELEAGSVADAAMSQGFARSNPEGLSAERFCAQQKDS
jgi:hypothetical protein